MPRYQLLLARAGVPIGLLLKDSDLVRRCVRPDLVDLGFQSIELLSVAAASVAEYYFSEGRAADARALLHRGIVALADARPDEDDYAFLMMVASHGDETDVPLAETVLHRVAEQSEAASTPAYAALFGALRASRRARAAEAASKAAEAAQHFRKLQWPYYEAQALELAGDKSQALVLYRKIGDVADVQRLQTQSAAPNRRGRSQTELTPREREIVALVVTGKSNRAIAETLVISERTVESHVASILAKLNVKTRAELSRLSP